MGQNKPIHTDWEDIAAFYRDFPPKTNATLDAMERLCENISKSHLRDGLFAHTSLFDLLIYQTKMTWPLHQTAQWLRISPDPANDRVIFSLEGGPPRKKNHWSRNVDNAQVLAHFNKFLRQLGWNYHPIADAPVPSRNGRFILQILRRFGWRG